MLDTTLLDGVLRKTETLIAGVRPEQLDLPTPCPAWTVHALENHLVGWVRLFAAAVNDTPRDDDPSAYKVAEAPAVEFRAARDALLSGLRDSAEDRKVRLTNEVPASMLVGMILGEYVTHGWDLATATGQAVPYTEDEAGAALTAMSGMLRPEYRGEAFGPVVPTPEDAPPLARLIAFTGRRPTGIAIA